MPSCSFKRFSSRGPASQETKLISALDIRNGVCGSLRGLTQHSRGRGGYGEGAALLCKASPLVRESPQPHGSAIQRDRSERSVQLQQSSACNEEVSQKHFPALSLALSRKPRGSIVAALCGHLTTFPPRSAASCRNVHEIVRKLQKSATQSTSTPNIGDSK